jgi:autotransporter-associated beta strand protein
MKKLILLVLSILPGVYCASAATVYFDVNGDTTGSGVTAGTYTWGAANALWSTNAAGEAPTAVWVNGDSAIFSAGSDAAGQAYILNATTPHNVPSIRVKDGSVQLTGSSANATTNTSLTIDSGQQFAVTTALTFVVPVTNSTCTINGGTMANANGGVGSSFFTGSAANGNMDIVLGTGGGTLSVLGASTAISIYTGLITGTGPLTVAGTGTFRLTTRVATYTGDTFVTGRLQISTTANVLPQATGLTLTSPGELNIQNTLTVASLSGDGNITGTSAGTLAITGTNSTTYNGIMQNGTSLTVNKSGGNGTLTLAGVNTFSGAMTLTAGTVTVDTSGALCGPVCDLAVNGGILNLNNTAQTVEDFGGTGGTVNLASGHTLSLSAVNASATRSRNYAGVIAGPGNIATTTANAGTVLTETLSGANTYNGSTTVTPSTSLIMTSASTGAGDYSNDGVLGVRPAVANGTLNVNNLALGSGSRMEFDYNYLGYPAAKLAHAAGTLTMAGGCAVDVKGFLAAGTSTLLDYAAGTGGSFTLGTIPPHVSATLNDDTVNNKLELVVSSSDSLIWVSDPNGVWDANNAANNIWKLASDSSATFYQQSSGYLNGLSQGDAVLFDDTLTGTNTVNLTTINSPYTVTVNNVNSNYTFTGAGKLSGIGTLTKSGTGLLTILNTNDYTGGTTVNAGTVAVGTNSVFGTGRLSINGGKLMSDSATARTISVPVTLAGDVTLGDAVNTGVLTSSGLWTVSGGPRQITVDSGLSAVISGALGGTGSLTKAGTGTLDLTAANTMTGGINHNGGTLRINNNTGLGAANSPVTLGNGVTLSTTAGTARTLTYNWTVNGNVTLGQTSGGTAALTLAGVMGLGVDRTITVVNATDTISAVVTNGAITKEGTGILALTGANTYSGSTTLNAGQINISGTSTLGDGTGTLNLNGGALNTTATRSVTTAPVPNPINLTADTAITTSSTATTVDLNLSGVPSGSTGTLTFRNDGADGAGDVFQPRFTAGGFVFSQPIVIDNGPTGQTRLMFFNTNGTTQIFGGVISGNGRVNRSVSSGTGGNTILGGDNTYSGITEINAGTLLVNSFPGSGTGSGNVSVNSGGTLSGGGFISGTVTNNGGGIINPGINPGPGFGILTLGNGLISSAGTYAWELEANSETPGNFDVISLTGGNLVLGGTSKLSVNFTGAASSPHGGNAFWNANHSWKVIALTAPASNTGNTDIYSVLNGVYTNGYFTTSVNGGGELLVNYTAGAPPSPNITSFTGAGTGTVTIGFTTAIKGATYQVQYKNDLNAASWSILSTTVVATPGPVTVNDTNPSPTQRFYRIVIL